MLVNRNLSLSLILILAAGFASAQESQGLEIDFLASYYDQDGENSPVTGGIGSEELQSASPVFLVKYTTGNQWLLTANLGLDNITSASIDNIDVIDGVNVSSASRKDNRVFTTLGAAKKIGADSWGFSLGFSKEYDYKSVNGGLSWSRGFSGNNTTLGAALNHYSDQVDLYDIDGIVQGSDDRTTTDLTLSLTRVLSPKTLGSVELNISDQSGFLSSPFQEVILSDGRHVAERLPDNRQRTALRFSLNHAFSDKLVGRFYYRYYDDDWEIQAHSLELEPHFRLPWHEAWIYPILRYHTQDGSNYFGPPETFGENELFFTADRDLSTFDSTKIGIGLKFPLQGRRMRRMEYRLTYYDRDDGLSAINLTFGFGWSFP